MRDSTDGRIAPRVFVISHAGPIRATVEPTQLTTFSMGCHDRLGTESARWLRSDPHERNGDVGLVERGIRVLCLRTDDGCRMWSAGKSVYRDLLLRSAGRPRG